MQAIQVIQDIQEYRTLEDQYTVYTAVQKVQENTSGYFAKQLDYNMSGSHLCPVGSVQ